MSWIPIPPISSTTTPSASSNSYSYPPPMNLPPPTYANATHPSSTYQSHWPLPHGQHEELFPQNKTANLQAILDKCNDQYFIGKEKAYWRKFPQYPRSQSSHCMLLFMTFFTFDIFVKTGLLLQNDWISGLEYVVEIQHVAHDKRGSWYSCRLCDVMFQSKDGSASCIDNMRQHLTLASHKLNYLVRASRFFSVLILLRNDFLAKTL